MILGKDNACVDEDNTVFDRDNMVLGKEDMVFDKDNMMLEKDNNRAGNSAHSVVVHDLSLNAPAHTLNVLAP